MAASGEDVLRQYLIDQGVVGDEDAADWRSLSGPMQSSPDNFVIFNDTGAVMDARGTRDADRNDQPTVQVQVRSAGKAAAKDKGAAIVDKMKAVGLPPWPTVTVDGDDYLLKKATAVTALTFIGEEEQNDRKLYSVNFRLRFGPSPGP